MTDKSYKITNGGSPSAQEPEKSLAITSKLTYSQESQTNILQELQVRQIQLEMQIESLRQAQQSSEMTRDRYLDLYDFAPIAYLTLDSDGLISEINLTAAKLLRFDRLQLIGLDFLNLVTDQSRAFWRLQSMSIQSGGNQSCELQMHRSDESVFHARVDYLLIGDRSNKPELRIALTEIRQQKQDDPVSAESQLFHTKIVESAMDAIICIDAKLRIVFFNTAAGKMFGCSKVQALGSTIERFIPSCFSEIFATPTTEFERESEINHKLNRLRTMTGLRSNSEEFPIEAAISRIKADEQTVYTLFLRDISSRTQAHSLLQAKLQLQDQLSKVAASVPGVICSFRLDEGGVASMPYASPALESLYGFAPEAVAEDFSPVFARIHSDDIQHINETIAESARTLEPWRDTFRYLHPSKGEIWVEGHSMPVHEADGCMLWHGYLQDITDRKQAETLYRDQEKELRLIMDATPALISYLDIEFKYLRVNATYERWFGITLEQIFGRKASDILGETAWDIVQPYLERARSGEQVTFDQQIPYGNGTPRWVHVTYIPNIDAEGKVKGIVVHVMDIEELKLAEQKIALLNQRLHHRLEEMQVIYNTVPIGLAISDSQNGQHIRGNPAIEQMLGLPPNSELSFESDNSPALMVLMNGSPLAVEDLPMQRACLGHSVSDQLLEIVRPDKQVISVLCNASTLFDDAGQPRGAVGAFLDVTPLKKADDALRSGEAFVRCVLNSMPAEVVVLDELGVITTINEPWERFAMENGGSTCHLSVGTDYLAICRRASATGDHDAERALAGLEALLAGQQQEFVLEYPCPTSKGQLWFLMHAKRITQGFNGVIITHIDITELKQTYADLHDTEARLALVIEEVNAGYWDWDLLSGKLFLSPEWKRQIGFDEHELRNEWEEWESRLHPDDRPFVLASIEGSISGHLSTYELEFRLRHKNGSYRWIHARGSLLRDEKGHPYRLLGINFDITDYKKTQEMNIRRNEMEQAFRVSLATQTIAALAHELNQPLAAISSYANVALRLYQSGKSDSQKLRHVLESCVQQTQRAGEVIRQLFSHLNKTESISEPIDINFLVSDTVEFAKKDMISGDFKFELDLLNGSSQIMANPMQIQKVLINLIRNGLESMQEQGKQDGMLLIKTSLYTSDPHMALVTVSDSGKGLVDSTPLKTLFQPFYSTKPAGLGMGLAISRALIQAHGGDMWAERNLGDGLSIHFTLPFAK